MSRRKLTSESPFCHVSSLRISERPRWEPDIPGLGAPRTGQGVGEGVGFWRVSGQPTSLILSGPEWDTHQSHHES